MGVCVIKINLDKAKTITHDKRRVVRAAEFAPLDVQVTIPSLAKVAEEQRQIIRDKYNGLQKEIDIASDVEELKLIMDKLNNP